MAGVSLVKLPSGDCYGWWFNIGPGIGLVLSGNKPLSQCWHLSMSSCGVSVPQLLYRCISYSCMKKAQTHLVNIPFICWHFISITMFLCFLLSKGVWWKGMKNPVSYISYNSFAHWVSAFCFNMLWFITFHISMTFPNILVYILEHPPPPPPPPPTNNV